MELKNNLKHLVEDNHSSLSGVAEAIGVPLSTLHGWLNGVEPKSVPQLKELADYFGVSLEGLCFSKLGESSNQEREKANPIEEYRDEINAGKFEVILRRSKN